RMVFAEKHRLEDAASWTGDIQSGDGGEPHFPDVLLWVRSRRQGSRQDGRPEAACPVRGQGQWQDPLDEGVQAGFAGAQLRWGRGVPWLQLQYARHGRGALVCV